MESCPGRETFEFSSKVKAEKQGGTAFLGNRCPSPPCRIHGWIATHEEGVALISLLIAVMTVKAPRRV